MRCTARQLNRATLQRQLLLVREPLEIAEAVRRIVAIQAQHPASPYVALWNRVEGFDPAGLDAAFAEHTVVKASLMRITLHAVHRDDYAPMHAAMQPTLRAARLHDRRFKVSGLTSDDVDRLLPAIAAFTKEPRLGSDMEAWLQQEHGIDPKPVWWALRSFAPLWHAVTDPMWSFGLRPHFTAAQDYEPADAEESLPALVRRYLEGFGPASVADIGQFALVQRPRIRAALEALADELERHDGPAGEELFDVAGAPVPAEDVPAPPRLLAMWDSILLAYADRSRVLPEAYRKTVIRNNGDVLPALLVDGYVAGVWRPADLGGIEVTAFRPLPARTWTEISNEAAALSAFVADRDPRVYRRYDRWWDKLPAGDTRVLP